MWRLELEQGCRMLNYCSISQERAIRLCLSFWRALGESEQWLKACLWAAGVGVMQASEYLAIYVLAVGTLPASWCKW